VIQLLGQQHRRAVEPPLHRLGRDAQDLSRLAVRQGLDPHQAEDLALVLEQAVDRLEHAAAVRRQHRAAAGRGRHQPFVQLHGGRLLI
jgi:hypothetical protein